MEIKLNVSIGATLQVKNAKGEWDWIKPEVGAEIKLLEGEHDSIEKVQVAFTKMWDDIVGPQFASVVKELITDQSPEAQVEDTSAEELNNEEFVEMLKEEARKESEDLDEDYY